MTQKDSQTALMDICGSGPVWDVVKYASCEALGQLGVKNSNEADESTLARKAAKYGLRCPYRKPTQVDEKKILRRAGESLLRNSAK